MSTNDTAARVSVIPSMRYRDANKAIDWLGRAFGFSEHAVYRDNDGKVMHAELTLGNGMIMLGEVRDSEFHQQHLAQPGDVGGKVTTSIYVVVPEVDAHFERARAAGAKILREPVTQDYGGRDYSCADLEGHVWSFGSYDPWAVAAAT